MTAVPYLGVHEAHSIAETQQRFPGVTVTGPLFVGKVSLGQDLWGKINALCSPVWAAGQIPDVTFKLTPSEVTSGAWDSQLAAVKAGLLAAGSSSRVRYWHEPEDNMSGQTFVAAQNHVYARISDDVGLYGGDKRIPGGGEKRWLVGWTAMAYAWRPGGVNPADWQGLTVDFYSVDVYSGVSFPATEILPEHPGFVRWYENHLPAGAPFYVQERGFQSPSSSVRTTAISREALWLARSDVNVAGYSYWNTGGTEADANWVLDAPGEAAVANLIHQLSVKS